MKTYSLLSLPFKGRFGRVFPFKGRFGGVFAVLLFLPLCIMAGKRDYMKDPKYLLGAVPEVDGIVTFQKSFSVTDKSEQQIYDVLHAYVANSLVGSGIQDPRQPYTRIISEDKQDGTVVARVEEYMTFTHVFLNLDRTRFRYMITASVKGQKVNLTVTQISYYYNEDQEGKNGVTYKAEEWIADKVAVNKKGTRLYPRSGKFRRMTVDRVEQIFKDIMDSFATKNGVVED